MRLFWGICDSFLPFCSFMDIFSTVLKNLMFQNTNFINTSCMEFPSHKICHVMGVPLLKSIIILCDAKTSCKYTCPLMFSSLMAIFDHFGSMTINPFTSGQNQMVLKNYYHLIILIKLLHIFILITKNTVFGILKHLNLQRFGKFGCAEIGKFSAQN